MISIWLNWVSSGCTLNELIVLPLLNKLFINTMNNLSNNLSLMLNIGSHFIPLFHNRLDLFQFRINFFVNIRSIIQHGSNRCVQISVYDNFTPMNLHMAFSTQHHQIGQPIFVQIGFIFDLSIR